MTKIRTMLSAAALLAAGTAHAATVSTGLLLTNGGSLAPGERMLLDFENPAPTASLISGATIVTGGSYGLYTGSVSGWAATPLGNTSQYLAVYGTNLTNTGPGTVNIDFGLRASSFSIDVGSIDTYNTFQVLFINGDHSWSGGEMAANYGNWTDALSNRRITFTAEGGEQFTGVRLISSQNSLEVDNIAVNAVPEPETWALMALGFGLIGGAARRRSTLRMVAA